MEGARGVDQVVLSRPPSITQLEPVTFALRGELANHGQTDALAGPVTTAILSVRLRSMAEKLRRFIAQEQAARLPRDVELAFDLLERGIGDN
jgi:hypothetical protein